MTSQERHEARYQRRKAKRSSKQDLLNKKYGDFDKIISFDSLYNSFYQCKKSVSWKASTQKYEANIFKNISKTREKLNKGETVSKGFYEFILNERGKVREIKSVHISERVVLKALNANCLIPILKNSLIYYNGASLKYRGISFHEQGLVKHLSSFYREHKRDGYILLIDYEKYFDNIQHQPIYDDVEKKIYDKRIINLVRQSVDPYGEKGLGLGSETNQTFAINFPNKIDHFITEILRIRYYARYMDDSYIIHESKEYLQECLKQIKKQCAEIGIVLNDQKIHIVKLTHSFTFLKTQYNLSTTGKIVRRVSRQYITRNRRKMKKLKKLYDKGECTLEAIEQSYQSMLGYFKNKKNSRKSLWRMKQLYKSLFNEAKMIELMKKLKMA